MREQPLVSRVFVGTLKPSLLLPNVKVRDAGWPCLTSPFCSPAKRVKGKKQLQGLTRLSAPANSGEQLSSIVADSSLRCPGPYVPRTPQLSPGPSHCLPFGLREMACSFSHSLEQALRLPGQKDCAPAPHSPSFKSNCQHRGSQGWFVFLVLPVQSVFYTISPALSPNTPMLFNSPSPFLISFSFFSTCTGHRGLLSSYRIPVGLVFFVKIGFE